LIGKKARLPLVGRLLPIIADTYVDRDFGTGALKVTPAHDHNDWRLGHKHQLEFVTVIDEDGRINEQGGVYAGLDLERARAKIVADLESLGLLAEKRPYENSVGRCYRCSTLIEPRMSVQWFVAANTLAAKARQAMPERTRIFPSSWLKTYYNWLDNIRDWCISRQLWWGHRIPAWTCAACGELAVLEEAPTSCPRCGKNTLIQDEDVLDTWFSSAIWPFSTLGWPEETPELARFYPTSVLVTGFDILFFWVARMMMMGLHFMGEVPFRHCYIHALVRDSQGKKMSKTTGNVIDPLEIIGRYGTDSLRFTLAAFAAMGRDIRLSEDRIEGYRHFMNKIWNAARFALMHLDSEPAPLPADPTPDKTLALHHRWILHRLEDVKNLQKETLAGYRFNDAAAALYKFVWNEFCDWYLELIKPDLAAPATDGKEPGKDAVKSVLHAALREILILLHPFVPFITSEIWDSLPGREKEKALSLTPFPASREVTAFAEDAGNMDTVREVISAARTMRAELNIQPSLRLSLLIRPADPEAHRLLEGQRAAIMVLARLGSLDVDPQAAVPAAAASSVVRGSEIILPLKGVVDFAAERARLDRELLKLEKEYAGIAAKVANPAYLEKARPEVVARDQSRKAELEDSRNKLSALKAKFADWGLS
ncbi:MAG: valine--tRNA ligase, partial [Desulfovibrio sp.]|nr:valine--tRNA ligase [Desulfovibrio sp.]